MPVKKLESSALYRRCDAKQFEFETTAELEDLAELIGQPRVGLEPIDRGGKFGIIAEGQTALATLHMAARGRTILIDQDRSPRQPGFHNDPGETLVVRRLTERQGCPTGRGSSGR